MPAEREISAAGPAAAGPVEWWRYAYRVPLLAVHLLVFTPLALVCQLPGLRRIPAGSMPLGARAHKLWARWALRAFGVGLRVRGELPAGPFLLVANHISWLDVLVLHAVWPVRLVAKAEIRHWPVFGWLAMVGGTIFIARGADGSRRRAGRRMCAMLRRGERVGVFPEGGIVGARGVGRFHARLFGPALRAPAPVVPVAIRYERNGDLHEEKVFSKGQKFLANGLRLLGHPPCQAQVMIAPALPPESGNRRELAERARAIVHEFYERTS